MRVIDYIEKHQLFVPDEWFAPSHVCGPTFTYLGMNADRSKLIVLLPEKGLFFAIEREPYRVITGSLVGDCPSLGRVLQP